MWVQSLGQEDPLEKGVTTHSSILAWRIPLTEEPGRGYRPGGCKEVDMTEHMHTHTHTHTRVRICTHARTVHTRAHTHFL